MSQPLPTLSDGILGLLETFEPHLHEDSIEIVNADVRIIVQSIRVMHQLADNMEQELAVFRLGEAGQDLSGFLDRESTGQLEALVADPEGKVISPDFRRKS